LAIIIVCRFVFETRSFHKRNGTAPSAHRRFEIPQANQGLGATPRRSAAAGTAFAPCAAGTIGCAAKKDSGDLQ
jgi:hypothetical protein